MSSYNDPGYAAQQYRDAGNLQARISLHARFSTNAYGWMRWIFDGLRLHAGEAILEAGCGPGSLWTENLDRIPSGCRLVLTDLSPGMVDAARDALADRYEEAEFRIADAQALPFDDAAFDVVIANHMLYHVPDVDATLREVDRVLRPGGRLFASTVGRRHLHAITELVRRFDPATSYDTGSPATRFGLENGASILARHFGNVQLHIYEDALRVTEPGLLVAYVASMMPADREFTPAQWEAFYDFVAAEMARDGSLYVEKAQGMFEAY